MEQLILPKQKRNEEERPQLNDVFFHKGKERFQRIELNRGCKRQCAFCWADPNMMFFEVPEIIKNKVMILGEGLLYDPNIKEKLIKLGQKRVNGKVVKYGLCQGVDFRLLTKEIAEIMINYRFGRITDDGVWTKGVKIAWDLGEQHEQKIKESIELLESVGYKRQNIQVFCLTLWKIPFETCRYKLRKLREWGVQIDDTTWNTNKKQCLIDIDTDNWNNPFWTAGDYLHFRRISRKHNQVVQRGYDPERLGVTNTNNRDLQSSIKVT